MARMIIKLSQENKSWYLEWSTVVDAPVLVCSSLEEYKKWYQEEYGRSSMDELERRLERVESKGTSSMIHDSIDDLILPNRCGKNETSLSKEQIIQYYCTEELSEKPLGEKLLGFCLD